MLQQGLALLDKVSGKLQGKDTRSDCALEVRCVARFVKAATPVVLDGGANKGDWTAEAKATWPKGRFILFEPSTSNRAHLAQRFSDVSVVPFALSDAPGKAELFADHDGSGNGSLHQRRLDHYGLDHKRMEAVTLTTLDAFCAEVGIDHVDVLKLDIEGHELAALRGAERILKTTDVVQFEFGGCNIDSRTYFQDFWYFFKERGFDLYRVTPFGPFRLDRYTEREECFLTANYLACGRNA